MRNKRTTKQSYISFIKPEHEMTFTAEILFSDPARHLKKGDKLHPKGFYFQRDRIVLVGTAVDIDTVRLSLPRKQVHLTIQTEEVLVR